MSETTVKEFLIIRRIGFTGKTYRYEVKSKGCTLLGHIGWYGSFRKYAFYPTANTVWDNKCLKEVTEFLEELMVDWRNNKKKAIS